MKIHLNREPRTNEEADAQLRKIVRKFRIENNRSWKDVAFAARAHSVSVVMRVCYGSRAIPESLFVRLVKGLEYLAAMPPAKRQRKGWQHGICAPIPRGGARP